MKVRSPVLGFNHNVRHKGRTFHVQTEDSGVKTPHIFTHLFHGGTIIRTNKLGYDPSLDEIQVKGLMQAQHKMILRELKSGTHDTKIVEYLGPHPEPSPGVEREAAPPVEPMVQDAVPAAIETADQTERMDVPMVPEAMTAPTASIPRAPAEPIIPPARVGPPPAAPRPTPPRTAAPRSQPMLPGARPLPPMSAQPMASPQPPAATLATGMHGARSSGTHPRAEAADQAHSAIYISARKGQKEEPFAKSKTGELQAVGSRPMADAGRILNPEVAPDSGLSMRPGRASTGEHAAMANPPARAPQRPLGTLTPNSVPRSTGPLPSGAVARPTGPLTPGSIARAPGQPTLAAKGPGTLPRVVNPTPGQIPAAQPSATRGVTPMGNALPASPPRPGGTQPLQRAASNVVVARPAVVIGGGAAATTRRQGAPQPAPAREKPQAPDGIFGQGLISERSLDEVILAYLSEDAPEE